MNSTHLVSGKTNCFGNQKLFHATIFIFFFISGACGLVYEIAWLRVMGLIFGNTTYATSTVLAGYMAGLGLGALFFGHWIDNKKNPVRVYGFLEGGVGAYALITPLIWKLIEFISIRFYQFSQASFLQMSVFKFIVAFTALLLPTFLMGGTLPVIAKFFVREKKDVAKDIGFLYAINTFGAVVGVFLSGFFLLYTIGVWQTAVITGCFNLCIFGASYLLSKNDVGMTNHEPAESINTKTNQDTSTDKTDLFWMALLILFGISGAVSMMYEIGWTRILAIVLGSSIYAFSVMLATFLLGIALGSYFFSLLAKKIRFGLFSFALFQLLTSFFALIGINQFESIPYNFVKFFEVTNGEPWLMEISKFFLCSIIMLPPTIFIGAMFACFIHLYQEKFMIGKRVGTAYFANTIGTILGSILTGFAIIPWIGIQKTLILAASLNALIGIAIFLSHPRNFRWYRIAIGGLFVFLVLSGYKMLKPWDKSIITSGTAIKPFMVTGYSQNTFLRALTQREILFYKEGISATVNVTRLKDNVSLAVNGKVDATNDTDNFTQLFLGHLPMLLHPEAKNALVIGLGSASTVAAVAAYPVQTIDCIELEKAVVEASNFFLDVNRNVLQDKRVRLFVDDGRNFLLTHTNLYDIIISEPSNPWMAGVANLFSFEHYQNMKKRLNQNGIVCQWLHAYSMSLDDLKMIVRTFNKAFPNVSLWTSYYPDLMLIGSNEKNPIDLDYVEQALNYPEVKSDLNPYGIFTAPNLLASYWLSGKQLNSFSLGAKINSDNWPYLEFSAPRYLYLNTTKKNFLGFNTFKSSSFEVLNDVVPQNQNSAAFYAELARGYLYKKLSTDAERALSLAEKIDPNSSLYREVSGIYYYDLDDLSHAETNLLEAIKSKKATPEAYYYLGLISQRQKQFEKAIRNFNKTLELAPNNIKYLNALGDCLSAASLNILAIQTYEKIILIRGVNYATLKKMLDAAFKSSNLEKQTEISNTILKHYPHSYEVYELLAQALEAEGKYLEAANIYKKLAEKIPNEPGIYLNLARLYSKIGLENETKECLSEAARLSPALKNNPQMIEMLKKIHGEKRL